MARVAFCDLGNRDDETDLPLWWSNSKGWTDDMDSVTLFADWETWGMHKPMGIRVVQVPVEVKFPIDL